VTIHRVPNPRRVGWLPGLALAPRFVLTAERICAGRTDWKSMFQFMAEHRPRGLCALRSFTPQTKLAGKALPGEHEGRLWCEGSGKDLRWAHRVEVYVPVYGGT
jgi:hypothetical protein